MQLLHGGFGNGETKKCSTHKVIDINQKIKWIHKKVAGTEAAFKNSREPGGVVHHVRQENSWRPPRQGWVKVNTDGCLKPNTNDAAWGGILRDSQAAFMGGFTYNLGRCSAIEAELWGILKGLECAWRNGYRRLHLETDCATALEMISDSETI